MSLKTRVADLSEVPEAMHQYYDKPAGSEEYLLRFEGKPAGFVPKEEVDNFRNNNSELLKKKQELETKLSDYSDLNPEEARDALKKIKDLNDKKLLDEGKIDELLASTARSAKEEAESGYKNQVKTLQDNITELQTKHDEYKNRYESLRVQNDVFKEIEDIASVKKNAHDLVMMSLSNIWSMDENGNLVAKENGKVVFDKAGTSPITPKEWAMGFVDSQKGNLFEEHSGGGSPNGGGPNKSTGGNNPWIGGDSFNLTEQARIMKADPNLAQRLKAAAGAGA